MTIHLIYQLFLLTVSLLLFRLYVTTSRGTHADVAVAGSSILQERKAYTPMFLAMLREGSSGSCWRRLTLRHNDMRGVSQHQHGRKTTNRSLDREDFELPVAGARSVPIICVGESNHLRTRFRLPVDGLFVHQRDCEFFL